MRLPLPRRSPLKPLLCSIALLALAVPCWPRYFVVFRLASPPLPVVAGQGFSLCAANVGTVNADLTLQFISVRTGAVIATRNLILPPPGMTSAMPDPCLTTTAQDIPAAGTDPPLVVALVIIRHGLFSRAAAATASVQVTAPTPAGERRTVASIPLTLATLTNGRNTPIEKQ
jgi:hypothetical protein